MAIFFLVEYYLIYQQDDRLFTIPVTAWAVAALTGVLGLAALAFLKCLLLALHAALSVALAAALACLNVAVYFLLEVRAAQ